MKVICIENNLKSFVDKKMLSRLKQYIFNSDGHVNLVIGKKYTVYSILFRDNMPWYYICDEEYDDYPTPFACEFFDVIDDRLSKYWKLSYEDLNNENSPTLLTFDEWANNPHFFEKLIDDDINSINVFNKYRQLMDKE